jgi:D-alanyl-D-alanine carboxypeptidase
MNDPKRHMGPGWSARFSEAWLSVKLHCMERTVPNHAIRRGNDPTCAESDALFPWWSITKTVLAAAVLRLVDSGKLSLDSFYRDRPYTIRQLLQHTAGLNTYGGSPYRAAVAAGDPVWPVDEVLARVKADRLIFSPGEGWAYSNVGYIFVRRLIEETVDMEVDEALRVLLFEPMGIRRTRIAKTPDDMAQTHWGNPNGYDPRWVYHGLLIGPPSDAVDFLGQLFFGPFLSEDSASAMKGMRALGGSIAGRPWKKTGYGLGLMIGEMEKAGLAYGHSGVGHESVSSLYCFPELPESPVVAVFGRGADEGVPEFEAVNLALG